MRYLPGVLAVFSSLALSFPASAAMVQAIGEDVFIDRGQGYASVSGPTSVKAGDVVMVTVGGSGEVIYDDGCRQAVEVGAVVVVGETSPCGLSEAAVDNIYMYSGLVIVGAAAGIIALSDDDDKCITQCTK